MPRERRRQWTLRQRLRVQCAKCDEATYERAREGEARELNRQTGGRQRGGRRTLVGLHRREAEAPSSSRLAGRTAGKRANAERLLLVLALLRALFSDGMGPVLNDADERGKCGLLEKYFSFCTIQAGIKDVLGSFINAFPVGKQGDETRRQPTGLEAATTQQQQEQLLAFYLYRRHRRPGVRGPKIRNQGAGVRRPSGSRPAGSPPPNPNRNEGDGRYERASRVWRTTRVRS